MRVYIVEDSAVVRDRLIALLTDLPSVEVVGHAERAADAVCGCRDLRPDVLILDLQLAQSSGFDVLQQVVEAEPAPLIMVLTNHDYPQYRRKCLRAGADFFFDKTAEFERVAEVLKQLFVVQGIKQLLHRVRTEALPNPL